MRWGRWCMIRGGGSRHSVVIRQQTDWAHGNASFSRGRMSPVRERGEEETRGLFNEGIVTFLPRVAFLSPTNRMMGVITRAATTSVFGGCHSSTSNFTDFIFSSGGGGQSLWGEKEKERDSVVQCFLSLDANWTPPSSSKLMSHGRWKSASKHHEMRISCSTFNLDWSLTLKHCTNHIKPKFSSKLHLIIHFLLL